jgi:hypothetical protein
VRASSCSLNGTSSVEPWWWSVTVDRTSERDRTRLPLIRPDAQAGGRSVVVMAFVRYGVPPARSEDKEAMKYSEEVASEEDARTGAEM